LKYRRRESLETRIRSTAQSAMNLMTVIKMVMMTF